MIFIAQGLPMNGGSTFLVRLAATLSRRGRACAVLLINDNIDAALLADLEQYARVFRLSDFLIDRGRLFRRQLAGFGLVRWRRLWRALAEYGPAVHGMGLLGLLFSLRLTRHAAIVPSVGIYHQNEFVYAHRSYFARQGARLFAALPDRQVVFFNEHTRENYGKHFGRSFSRSSILPIGISLPSAPVVRHAPGTRLVSVGNLETFKTYNRHVIDILPELAQALPGISYDIYGSGPEQVALERQIARLGLGERVRLMGRLDYADFGRTVTESDVFIGSGTALVEAAALGRPAVIGIESIAMPMTYGFLSDVPGLTYNEAGLDVPLRPLRACIEEVLSDAARYDAVAAACATKARMFSMEKTADGFMLLDQEMGEAPQFSVPMALRMLTSAISTVMLQAVGLSDSFGGRRNQSFKS